MDRAKETPGRSEEFKWGCCRCFQPCSTIPTENLNIWWSARTLLWPSQRKRHTSSVMHITQHLNGHLLKMHRSHNGEERCSEAVITLPHSPCPEQMHNLKALVHCQDWHQDKRVPCFNLISPFTIHFAFQYPREVPSSIKHYSANKIQQQNFSIAQLLALHRSPHEYVGAWRFSSLQQCVCSKLAASFSKSEQCVTSLMAPTPPLYLLYLPTKNASDLHHC